MNSWSRKEFLFALVAVLVPGVRRPKAMIMTVHGAIDASALGRSLVHEHVLVDFIGADKISSSRWKMDEVIETVLPFLLEAKQAGVKSFFDCTPDFLGRDAMLLKKISSVSGVQIITNTGYYGAVNNKYLPPWAFTETAAQLAERWTNEFRNGIAGTGIRPGFIKIGVGEGPLSDMHKKLVKAAALTHLETGLTIFSHTGPAIAAFEQLEILKGNGVDPSAFVWVHAQAEKDKSYYLRAAKEGCWVSLDGIGWGDTGGYTDSLVRMKAAGLLNRVLISHDAGWYKPGEEQASFKGYTTIFKLLIPALLKNRFSKKDINRLLISNPAAATMIRVRKKN